MADDSLFDVELDVDLFRYVPLHDQPRVLGLTLSKRRIQSDLHVKPIATSSQS